MLISFSLPGLNQGGSAQWGCHTAPGSRRTGTTPGTQPRKSSTEGQTDLRTRISLNEIKIRLNKTWSGTRVQDQRGLKIMEMRVLQRCCGLSAQLVICCLIWFDFHYECLENLFMNKCLYLLFSQRGFKLFIRHCSWFQRSSLCPLMSMNVILKYLI